MRAAWIAPLLTVLAGCGAEQTRLRVVVRAEGPDGPARTQTISCAENDPLCRRLRTVLPSTFGPVPDGAVCTQIYGGPATARVTGRLDGELVDARFSLRNGCQIGR